MGFTDNFNPEGSFESPVEKTDENNIPANLNEIPTANGYVPETGSVKVINPNSGYVESSEAPAIDPNNPNLDAGSNKIINQNSVYGDFSGNKEASPEVAETTVNNEITPEAVAEDTLTEDSEGGVLDVMDVEGAKDNAETPEPDEYQTGKIINPEDPPAYPETPIEIDKPKPTENEDVIKDDPIQFETLDNIEKTEQELRKEQNIELMNTLFENHKKAFIKPKGKDYLILRDSKNRVLEINSGSLMEQSGGEYSKYTYVFSEKGVSMVVFDERLYNNDYSSNLDDLLDADFSENKDDKYIKITSSDKQRYFDANVRNCKNIAELDEKGIKGIVDFVEKENPAPIEPEEIKAQTDYLKAFFAETN